MALAVVLSQASGARATPLFFPLGGGVGGFDPAAVASSGRPVLRSTPTDTFLCSGSGDFVAAGPDCEGKTDWDLTVVQQDMIPPAQVLQDPASPMPGNPLVVDALWRVTNSSGTTFDGPVFLIFSNINLTDFPGNLLGRGYDDIESGLEADLLSILQYTVSATDYFWGAAPLGVLAPGESSDITVRYVVNAPLPTSSSLPGNPRVLPPLSGFGYVVPEPKLLVLLGSAFAGLALRRRT
jgi:hypothetical protein